MKQISLVLLVSMFMLVTKVYAYDDHDLQVWNTDTEEFKVSKDAKAVFEEEFRWGNNADDFYYHHYDAGFFYNLKKYLNIGGGYRHVYELKKGESKLENEPYITATLLWGLKGFKFEDRSRLEYRHFDYQRDSWRYRNKVTLKLPWKFTKLEIQSYISDEILVGFSKITELNQNRFSSGLSMNLTKNLKAEIYYILQSAKSSDKCVDTNVLGTKLKIVF
ncbi:MAG: hypothetical protein AUJ74_01875 [Candidatus Omnitrophica bacterium CG1_02_44_16]|nr:MAG: hypothetical protein AUJ74_01875 [Candidatus Omnitrophica bacterium CG1_02_44_16]PIY83555.1 MAG: hypothetical protein COY78_01810 [Candidatus Omnitrophica bacterium CG_4_10_14_0_8_um_filter_44_12]PIZ83957.1 MAG: hypothetical protein COX96_06175 [Candidatus Omnitrophica bacterium CG_4_10_14_0_2_um_filter_44_9]